MRITKLRLENFLSFKKEKLELGDLTIMVGPNGAGKTNALRALRLLGDYAASRISRDGNAAIAPDYSSYFNDPSKLLRISAEVKVDEGEREMMGSYLRLAIAQDLYKVPTPNQQSRDKLIEKLVMPEGPLDDIIPEPICVALECRPPTPYGVNCRFFLRLRFQKLNRELCSFSDDPYPGSFHRCEFEPSSEIGPVKYISLPDIMLKQLKELGAVRLMNWPPLGPQTLMEVAPEKFEAFGQLKLADALSGELDEDETTHIWITRSDLETLFLKEAADRYDSIAGASRQLLGLLYEIGYPIQSGRIVSLEFLVLSLLTRSIFVLEQLRGPVPEAIDISDLNASGATRSLDTREAVLALARLEHISNNVPDRRVLAEIRKMMWDMVSLNPYTYLEPTGNSFRVKVKFEEDGRELTPDLVPAGAIELLSVLTAIVAARGGVLLLDEPGQNLHPTMQVKLLRTIGSLAFEQGTQVVIVTHSPYMLDPELVVNNGDKVRVYRISRACGYSKVHALFEGEDREEVLKWMVRNPSFRAALFSGAAVVVEGWGELVFLEALQGRGLLPGHEPVVVIYGEGKGAVSQKSALEKYLKWLDDFGVPALAFCDSKCYDALPENLRQRVVAEPEQDLGEYIRKRFGNECSGKSAPDCKDISTVYRLMREADDKLLDEIAKELGLKDRLEEILRLKAQECRDEQRNT
ncbi:MAG: AAA family ATPase [Nitrososphaeria archaeon]